RQIVQHLQDVAAAYDIVTLRSVGQTYEGRELYVVTINTTANATPAIWIDCGIHAREWIAPATCLWMLSALTAQYGVDATITALVDSHRIHMMPVANPDGYVYSWTDDRLWRKNRNPLGGGGCAYLGEIGASNLTCASAYHGTCWYLSWYVVVPSMVRAGTWGGIGASNLTCASTYHGTCWYLSWYVLVPNMVRGGT
ncbi:carboxypeptidase B, partial [Hyalella azteca]|uniref:Carboxypeptidase B n=1 Tax=Hyalella azteca TaxID=294128 RepID=A0A8B7NLL1_HYAAZ